MKESILVRILLNKLIEFQELSISITLLFLALMFIQDSGDDDDQGGGLMQPSIVPIPVKKRQN